MGHRIAIDFGTTNSVLVRWNAEGNAAEGIHIPGISAGGADTQELLVPSLLYVQNGQTGQVTIGQAVLDHGLDRQRDNRLFRNFKRGITTGLEQEPRIIDGVLWTDQDAGRCFLRELIRMMPFPPDKIEQLVLTVPVAAYEGYASWLRKALQAYQPAQLHIVDESTAAALGYAITESGTIIMLIDFGGGTLDISLVRLPENHTGSGRKSAEHLWQKKAPRRETVCVIAKTGGALGGNDIDQWLLDEMLTRASLSPQDLGEDCTALLMACEQAKIALSTIEETLVEFDLKNAQRYSIPLRRAELENLIEKNGFYTMIRQTVDSVMSTARRGGIFKEDVRHVILVGGTALIPSIQRVLKDILGDTIVRVDKPFTAIAEGALQMMNGLELDDCLMHSYSLRYLDTETGKHVYDEIIPVGCRYPTKKPVKVQLSAAHPAQGAVEFIVGQVDVNARAWAAIRYEENEAAFIVQSDREQQEVIPLNSHEAPSVTVRLNPPGAPGQYRLQAEFTIDAQRQLRLSVLDLQTHKKLLHNAIVARLSADQTDRDPADGAEPKTALSPDDDSSITGNEPQLSIHSQPGQHRLSLRGLSKVLDLLPATVIPLEVLFAALHNPDYLVRFHAAEKLGQRGDREARRVMQNILEDGPAPSRASVIRQVYRLSWFAAEPLIRQALSDSDQRVVEGAILALCKTRRPDAYQIVADVLHHADDALRMAAVWGVQEGADPVVGNLWRFWGISEKTWALSAAPPVASIPVLEMALQSQAQGIRVAALETLSATQAPEAVPMVRKALADADPEVKYTATLSLIELMEETCLVELSERITLTDGAERLPIMRGLFHATNYLFIDLAQSVAAEEIIKALRMALRDELSEVRVITAKILAWMHSGQAAAILQEGYHAEKDSDTKARILLAAIHLLSPAGKELLHHALQSQDSHLRKTAENLAR